MSSASFRPDVEGLRALAIGVVLLSHAGLGFAEGGYVGVDVFFVISGFVITQALNAGTLSLVGFYARRVKRLLPQVIVALGVVLVLTSLLLSPVQGDAVVDDVHAAGAYFMNWRLSASAVDYFASGQDGPLDHFWSLAVEEQFYFVWPLLVIVLTWGGRRARIPLVIALAAIVIGSLVYAVHAVGAAPDQAYFSPVARAWELGLGGLVAVVAGTRSLGRRWSSAAAWGGLAAIVAATVTFDATTAVPGLAALLPTLGAVALIVAGSGERTAAPTRALTLAPVRFVGRISYALYIWHWPALVFAAAAWGPLSTAEGIAVVLASVLPAVVTYRWIELPVRRWRIHVRRPRLTAAGALLAPAFAVAGGVALSASIASPPALSASEVEGAPQLQKTRSIQASARALRPRPRDAADDRGRGYGCLVSERATTSPQCVHGNRRSARTVVIFGDSHAMQLFPAIEQMAARRRWRIVELTKAGCPPSRVRVVFTISDRSYAECDAWREHALRRIGRERAAMVVVTGSARYTVIERGRRLGVAAGDAALADGYPPVLTRLRRSARRVVVLRDTPRPSLDIPDCVSEAMDDLRRCAFPRGRATRRAGIVSAAAEDVKDVRVVDPTDGFCLEDLCPAVIGDVLVYRNSGHITATYMKTLGPWLARRMAF